jgi:hypothetical protein
MPWRRNLRFEDFAAGDALQGQEMGGDLYDDDVGAVGPPDRGELAADRPAADDDDGTGQVAVFQGFAAGDDAAGNQVHTCQLSGTGAHGQEDMAGVEEFVPATEADAVRSGEGARVVDDLDAVAFQQSLDPHGQLVDDGPAAVDGGPEGRP